MISKSLSGCLAGTGPLAHVPKNNTLELRFLMMLAGLLVFIFGFSFKAVAHEDFSKKYRYHYIPFSKAVLPTGADSFKAKKIDDRGRVYGDVIFRDGPGYSAIYQNGVFTPYQNQLNTFVDVNVRGTLAGDVYTDDFPPHDQAALIQKGTLKTVPFLAGETDTSTHSINDYDSALIYNKTTESYRLFDNGRTLVNFKNIPALGPGGGGENWEVNNKKVVGGTVDGDLNIVRAARFRPPYYQPQTLAPLPGDTRSLFLGLNNCGNVLAASTKDEYDAKHRYGIWDAKGHFTIYYTPNGSETFRGPMFNDSNLIALSDGVPPADYKSYLVPKPGVRLDIKKLLDNPAQVKAPLNKIFRINNRGDMIGGSICVSNPPCPPDFLLKRLPVKH